MSSKREYIKKCESCSLTYTSKSIGSKYCSAKCKTEAANIRRKEKLIEPMQHKPINPYFLSRGNIKLQVNNGATYYD